MKSKFGGLRLATLAAMVKEEGFSSEWGEAVIEAGQTASASEFEHIANLLKSDDKGLRRNVAAVMAQIPNPQVTRLLVENALEDRDEEIVKVGISVLMRMRQSAVDLLREIMENSIGVVHVRAALILVEIGHPEGIGILLESLERMETYGNEDLLPRILEALGELGDPRGVAPLIGFLVGDNWLLRLVASKALVKIGEPSVDTLLSVVRDHGDWDARCRAVEALGQIGSAKAVGPLVELLRENDGPVQNEIINALGRLGDPASVEALTEALGTGDPEIHFRASKALVSIGKPAVNGLSQLLQKHTKSDVRRSATVALGQIGDADAVPSIILALADENSLVRKAATDALGSLRDPRAISPLCRTLEGENWFVVRGAADALAEIGDVQAVGPLLRALKDDRGEVRQQIVKALEKLCLQVDRSTAAQNGVCDQAIAQSELDQAQFVGMLIDALEDNDPLVRSGVARILAHMKSNYVQQILQAITDQETPGATEIRAALAAEHHST